MEQTAKDAAFDALIAQVAACRVCPTMEGRRRVMTRVNGNPDARVVIVAEAPGRGGAERTGIPFSGDFSGRTFDRLLVEAGLTRDEVFITNAALCNPQGPTGANRPPSRSELTACSTHLTATLALVDPVVVVALGAVALAALGRIEPHGLKLTEARGQMHQWNARLLVPLFHPSPKVIAWYPYERMAADWRVLGLAVAQTTVVSHKDEEETQ